MREEAKKYFTPEEADALIPELTKIMERLIDAHQELAHVRRVLQEEQHRITMAGGGVLDRQSWKERAERLEALTREIQDGLSAIVSLGGIPKDLDKGLVDFPHLMEDREVNLCWRFGETKIRFWHGLDEGYAGRKPL
ncbi:MAG: DUF2203 domain-containing protein [Candidatus Rokubacteria bacterium]|nr:DUF2203 domain-containing protein [Candidatus Rokubacteria bacterium]